jgi:hypothetical protein
VTTPDQYEQHTLAAAMASKYIAAHHAEDPQAEHMLKTLLADQRGFALAFGAVVEMFIAALNKLEQAGAIGSSVQVWLDRHAMHLGAQADAIVDRYRDGAE